MKPLAARFIISSRGKRACFPRASQRQRDFLLSGLVSVRLDVILSSGVKVHPGSPGNRLPSMTSADSTDMFYSWRADGVFSSANYNSVSLRKQPTFGDATTGFLTKWRLRNERWNSILTMRHYPDLGGASDWSCRIANLFQPSRVISMEFLRSFLRRHLMGKPVVASPNVGSFLRLISSI